MECYLGSLRIVNRLFLNIFVVRELIELTTLLTEHLVRSLTC